MITLAEINVPLTNSFIFALFLCHCYKQNIWPYGTRKASGFLEEAAEQLRFCCSESNASCLVPLHLQQFLAAFHPPFLAFCAQRWAQAVPAACPGLLCAQAPTQHWDLDWALTLRGRAIPTGESKRGHGSPQADPQLPTWRGTDCFCFFKNCSGFYCYFVLSF